MRLDACWIVERDRRDIAETLDKTSGYQIVSMAPVSVRGRDAAQMFPHSRLGLVTGRFCWMLVHAGPDAIVYTDIGGLIRFWNLSAERLFGYSAEEALGKSLGSVIPAICCEQCWGTYAETSLGENRYAINALVSVPVRRKNGECVLIEFTTFRDLDRDGTPVGIAVIARDVTERVRDQQISAIAERCPADRPKERCS
jgi:PAS domain S-box-containing protein